MKPSKIIDTLETYQKLMLHFTVPVPEVDPDEEEPNEEEMNRRKEALEKKVKEWALKKMDDLFRGWKKDCTRNLF